MGNRIYTFTPPINYAAYVNRTNEKYLLQYEILRAYKNNELPITEKDEGKKILDVGCGLGTHTVFLKKIFYKHHIFAIDVSDKYCSNAKNAIIDIGYQTIVENVAFEDFHETDFDFVLASHILQYIQSPLLPALKKIISFLNRDGEAWIVLQEDTGLNEIITECIPLLERPSDYFKEWFVHQRIRNLLCTLNLTVRNKILNSIFKNVDVNNIKTEDLQFLSYLLLEEINYDNIDLFNKLDNITKDKNINGMLPHDVGISKIRKVL